jgi:hypothetical protein
MIGKTSRGHIAECKAKMDKQALFFIFHGEHSGAIVIWEEGVCKDGST